MKRKKERKVTDLSRAMAVMLRVETNTETDVTKGNILHRTGSGLHGQKLICVYVKLFLTSTFKTEVIIRF